MSSNDNPSASLRDDEAAAREYARLTTTARCAKMATDECAKCAKSQSGYCDFRSRREAFLAGWQASSLNEYFPIL